MYRKEYNFEFGERLETFLLSTVILNLNAGGPQIFTLTSEVGMAFAYFSVRQ